MATKKAVKNSAGKKASKALGLAEFTLNVSVRESGSGITSVERLNRPGFPGGSFP